MIALPPGCQVSYEIQINISELTNEIGEWFVMIGGQAWATVEYDNRGRQVTNKYVQYGTAKASYHRQDSTGQVLIRFAGTDASTASMFLLKFMDLVVNHNLKAMENYVY